MRGWSLYSFLRLSKSFVAFLSGFGIITVISSLFSSTRNAILRVYEKEAWVGGCSMAS